jgi:hypothetical protein
LKQAAKYNSPHLELNDGIEWLSFHAVCQVLQHDPVFGRVINTFVDWDGSINDTTDPAYSYCPYCRVSPFPSESAWLTERQHLAPLALRITLAVKGTRVRELLNLWTAMRTAIFPLEEPQLSKAVNPMTAVGIWRPTIVLNAYGASDEDADGSRMLIADGTIRFALPIPT